MPVQSATRRRSLAPAAAAASGAAPASTSLKARQHLDKYRVERRLAEGGFANVYRAYDTIEGLHVALKVPHRHLGGATLEDVCREVRLSARLQHPNILSIKTAGLLEGRFVIVYPLGLCSLAERLQRRIATETLVAFTEQMISAVAHAHRNRIIHCDLKPENFVLFEGNQLKLTDFGIARIALRSRTLDELGVGTIGYVAPEQALGKPSFSSDVFSLGLLLYRMWSGQLPAWPYAWPPPGVARLKARLRTEFIELIRRAIAVHEQDRFADAIEMEQAFHALEGRLLRRPRPAQGRMGRESSRPKSVPPGASRRPPALRCEHCDYAVADLWDFCPWCGQACARSIPRGHRRAASRA